MTHILFTECLMNLFGLLGAKKSIFSFYIFSHYLSKEITIITEKKEKGKDKRKITF